MCNYLSKRGATYYFRRVVPDDLREKFGRKEWVYSLGTKDREAGKRGAQAGGIETSRLIDVARSELAAAAPFPPRQVVGMPVAARATIEVRSISERDIEAMEYLNNEADQKAFAYDDREAARQTLVQRLRGSTASLSEMEAAARDIIREYAWKAELANDQRMEANVCLATVEAQLHHPPNATVTTKSLEIDTGTLFTDVIDRCYSERKVRPKTKDAAIAVVRWFQERGGPLYIEQTTRKHVLAFKDKLVSEGQSPANVNMKLNRLAVIVNWGYANDLVEKKWVEGIRVHDPISAKDKRLPFGRKELDAIFSSPVYKSGNRPSGCRGEAAYWMPLLSLYTGARLEELGQLRNIDIIEEIYLDNDDRERHAWVIKIREDHDDKLVLKNRDSIRTIPIHHDLISAGFLKYVSSLDISVSNRIFHEFKPNTYGTLSAKWGEWFGKYLRNECAVTNNKMTFHSFRHLFTDNIRHAGISDNFQKSLLGHSTNDITGNYGSGYSLHQLVLAMRSYRIPGFILSDYVAIS